MNTIRFKMIAMSVFCIFLFSSLIFNDAEARPNLTPEELTKAREVAAQMDPPIDFDILLDEADRFGIKCMEPFTEKAMIRGCFRHVKIAKNKKEIEASKDRIEGIRAEREEIQRQTIESVNKLSEKADKKLQQMN